MDLVKAHWEAWSKCNLRCGFCYRMKSKPVGTGDAKIIISKVAASGFRDFVFAGGDPFIRDDIAELIVFASDLGLKVEVQTNCELLPESFSEFAHRIDLFGFSVDSSNATLHDALRGKAGNFDRVIRMLKRVDDMGVASVVRTVVTKKNYKSISDIGLILRDIRLLRKWSIVEFTPVGDGYLNKDLFSINQNFYDDLIVDIGRRFGEYFNIDAYRANNKSGVYFLIKSDGGVYTSGSVDDGGLYQSVGNILSDDVVSIVDNLNLNLDAHNRRYMSLMEG